MQGASPEQRCDPQHRQHIADKIVCRSHVNQGQAKCLPTLLPLHHRARGLEGSLGALPIPVIPLLPGLVPFPSFQPFHPCILCPLLLFCFPSYHQLIASTCMTFTFKSCSSYSFSSTLIARSHDFFFNIHF